MKSSRRFCELYGRILAETWRAEDNMVVTELDASLLAEATGRSWIRARRPQLYAPLTVPTGLECDTRKLKFEEWLRSKRPMPSRRLAGRASLRRGWGAWENSPVRRPNQ